MNTTTATTANSGKKPFDAIVIGAGIAGCTLAYELASRGVKTVVLEQSIVAAESSGKNTGTLFTGPQKEVVELFDASVEVYTEIANGPIPFEFVNKGHLLIAETEEEYENASAIADGYRAAGVGMQPVSGAELARDQPQLSFKVAGGYFAERSYSLEPMGATHAFAHAGREAGAEFRTGCRVAQVTTQGGKVSGVLTDQGIVSADMVFIATGMFMPELLRRTVGQGPLPSLPFTAGRGWLLQLGKLDIEIPWMVEEFSWPDQELLGKQMAIGTLSDISQQLDDQLAVEAICLNPMAGGDARLGATIQPSLRDLVRNVDVASGIAARTIRMMNGMAGLRVTNAYMGDRPMLSDGMPVAGRSPIQGLFVHGGMGSIGMHAAPATARWLADAVVNGDGNPPQEWLQPSRFPGWG